MREPTRAPSNELPIAAPSEVYFDRLSSVLEKRGVSRSSHYKDIKDGKFPRPVKLGLRTVGWPQHETNAVNAARLAGKSDEEIRSLVAQLEAIRSITRDVG